VTIRVLRLHPPLVIRQTGITIPRNGGVGTLQLWTARTIKDHLPVWWNKCLEVHVQVMPGHPWTTASKCVHCPKSKCCHNTEEHYRQAACRFTINEGHVGHTMQQDHMWHLLRTGQNIGQAPWAFDRMDVCYKNVQSINNILQFPLHCIFPN
jgi:hypothetical protein